MASPGRQFEELVPFLQNAKHEFLQSRKVAQEGAQLGRDDKWVIVVGNSAGDLDSVASAIAFAYLSTFAVPFSSAQRRFVPLLQTRRTELHLRPENELALSSTEPPLPASALLCIDDLPSLPPSPLPAYVIVDHNKAESVLVPASNDTVIGILDHHADEQAHLSGTSGAADDTGLPLRKIINPTGSCASIVAAHFKPYLAELSPYTLWNSGARKKGGPPPPRELRTVADLLLGAILLDTNNLRPIPKGKATSLDLEAVEVLLPFSSHATNLIPTEDPAQASDAVSAYEEAFRATGVEEGQVPGGGGSGGYDRDAAMASLDAHFGQLRKAKSDVSHLSTRELLARDWKEYAYSNGVRAGLASCPLGLAKWLKLGAGDDESKWAAFLQAVDAWIAERKLDICGVGTSFSDPPREDGRKGKHRRELVLVIREGAEAKLATVLDLLKTTAGDKLDLRGWAEGKGKEEGEQWEENIGADRRQRVRVWKQGECEASRKQIAPLLKEAVESLA